MEKKYLSIAEIYKSKLDLITSKKTTSAAKLKEVASKAGSLTEECRKRLKASQDKIVAVEKLIEASRKEGLEPSQQQVDALASRKREHANLEKELADDSSIKDLESSAAKIKSEIAGLEKEELAAARNLELANQLESEWHGETFSTMRAGDTIFTQEVSGVPDLLVIPSLKEALRTYFKELPMTVKAGENNVVTSINLELYTGGSRAHREHLEIPVVGKRKRRILCPYAEGEWIDHANALSKNGAGAPTEGKSDGYICSHDNVESHSTRTFRSCRKTPSNALIYSFRDHAHHPNRACFFYAEDTATAYALKPGSIDRCELIRKENRRGSYYPGESHEVIAIFVKRTQGDYSSLFTSFKEAIDEAIATVASGIDPENLPKNELGDSIAELLANTTELKMPLTPTESRPASEEAFKLIEPYWEALVNAPWGPEILGTYADIKDLCLSGAKPHAWVENAVECVGLRFKSKTEAWLVAHVYCPPEYQGKSSAPNIEVRSLRQGSNYKATGTPGERAHLIQSGPCFIRILSHPDR